MFSLHFYKKVYLFVTGVLFCFMGKIMVEFTQNCGKIFENMTF